MGLKDVVVVAILGARCRAQCDNVVFGFDKGGNDQNGAENRGSLSSARPPLSLGPRPPPILFLLLAFLPPIDLYTSLAASFRSLGVIVPSPPAASAHLAALPLPNPACAWRPEGVDAPDECRLLMSTRRGSYSGSAFGSDRFNVWWNRVFQLTLDSVFVHTKVDELGIRGVGRAERRGVLSNGSKNSVPSSNLRFLPSPLPLGISGIRSARFWRYHTASNQSANSDNSQTRRGTHRG